MRRAGPIGLDEAVGGCLGRGAGEIVEIGQDALGCGFAPNRTKPIEHTVLVVGQHSLELPLERAVDRCEDLIAGAEGVGARVQERWFVALVVGGLTWGSVLAEVQCLV